jgi:hypothetical protein
MAQAREETIPSRVPFWFKPVSTFGLLFVTTRNERSLMLVVLIHPLYLSTFVLADSASPRGSTYRMYGGYFVPGASHQAVASFACPGRERLMEQPVSSGLLRSVKQRIKRLCRSHRCYQTHSSRGEYRDWWICAVTRRRARLIQRRASQELKQQSRKFSCLLFYRWRAVPAGADVNGGPSPVVRR